MRIVRENHCQNRKNKQPNSIIKFFFFPDLQEISWEVCAISLFVWNCEHSFRCHDFWMRIKYMRISGIVIYKKDEQRGLKGQSRNIISIEN